MPDGLHCVWEQVPGPARSEVMHKQRLSTQGQLQSREQSPEDLDQTNSCSALMWWSDSETEGWR